MTGTGLWIKYLPGFADSLPGVKEPNQVNENLILYLDDKI